MILADRIAVMMNGQIQQVGTPYEIFNKPLNEEIADFVGVENILHGVVQDNENGIAKIEVDMGPLTRVKWDTKLVALITKQSRESLELRIGAELYATFKATSVHVVR
jgi:molybdopterin-binding protein